MKPDGVVVAGEPMETLDSIPVNEAAPAEGQETNQAANEDAVQQPEGEAGKVDKPEEKETPSTKTPVEPKAKTTSKGTAKTKPAATKTTTNSRPNTAQSRLSNGVSKPQTNGVAKKSTAALDKKTTSTTAPSKKPLGTTAATKSITKVAEKKPTAPSPATKSTTATKKTPPATANGVKTSTPGATKKPAAPKSASTTPSKPSSASTPKADKTPVSKTRPTAGTPASSRPTTGSTRPPTSSTTKSTATSKPATSKTPSTAAKPAASKPAATTPSAGKLLSSTPKTTTPAKKDAAKPAATAAKKAAPPSSTVKSAKPETPKSAPKSNVAAKKPTATKAAESKTPTRPKTQESKTPSKEAPKTTAAKKTPTAKKMVGSSTPTPVKRTPKPAAAAEADKIDKSEIAAAVATAAAIATTAAAIVVSDESGEVAEAPKAPQEGTLEPTSEHLSVEPALEPVQEPTLEPVREKTPEPLREATPEPPREPTPEPLREPTPEPPREPTPEPPREPTPEPFREPTPEPFREPTPEPPREPTPEPLRAPTPEPLREPTPEPPREPTPEPPREPTPEPPREPTPEPLREPTPESLRELTPEPQRQLTPEPPRDSTPEPLREHTPEPMREPTPEPQRELTPEPLMETTPELIREETPEPQREPSPVPHREPSPEFLRESSPEPARELTPEPVREPTPEPLQMSAQPEPFHFHEPVCSAVPSLGTTVMSPPCSPPRSFSPAQRGQEPSALLDMHSQPEQWERDQTPEPDRPTNNMMDFVAQEEYHKDEELERHGTSENEEEDEDEKGMLSYSTVPSMEQPSSFMGDFNSEDLSPREKEVAVEKADEEINEDDEEEDDDDEEDEEQRRLGHQPSSIVTDMSTSQPSEEFQIRSSAFGNSAGWHGDDLLSGMDSEDVSSCTSSRQQGVSDMSSTLHTAILEGTQSSDALIDSSLRGSECDGNLMGSPNVETLANEEEDDEDEQVDHMDLSSERVEEHHKAFQQHDEEDDEDVEMHSEGVTESCEQAEEDEFNEDERLDNLNHGLPPATIPPASSWGQSNPFSDTWAQPASLLAVSSPSPVSDHAESETPTQSPAQACLDLSAPSFESEQEHQSFLQPKDHHVQLHAPALEVSQGGTALAAHSGSETSTPEDLRDYDSSSGVESRSDKQQTPVPSSVHPDMDQDLGIHLEKGDGEEEEAETLPADEVLGTGPSTAPASAPSSPSTSGDEASDTEGEMQINDPDMPLMMEGTTGFESTPAAHSLSALAEDEEVAAGEAEEDGGGATPQSANSVASYGFDCTTSNSNAHSMAESCGKSPGIFSLENEEQLPEEAKDPSLIKELTFPSAAAAAQAEDFLGRPVDLLPLGFPEDKQRSLDNQHFMLEGKLGAEHLEDLDPLEPHHLVGGSVEAGDSQQPYYSTICDKTDSFLAGNV